MRNKTRRLVVEPLEGRQLLAAEAIQLGNWHNESNALDVSGDGDVSVIDALQIVNAISEYGVGSVDEIQSVWYENRAVGQQVNGGFHPDVSGDGQITATDLVRTVNRLTVQARSADGSNQVKVIPSMQGRPLQVMLVSEHGRSVEVDVSRASVSVEWTGAEVFVSDEAGRPLVIAKPDAGIFQADYSGSDGEATVTRLDPDGTEVIERYLCVPGWNEREIRWLPNNFPLNVGDNTLVSPNDIRQPIAGFEEVLGSMVTRRIHYTDGSAVRHEYEEGVRSDNPISLSVTLQTGEQIIVDTRDFDSTIDLDVLEADVRELLRLGYRPADAINPNQVGKKLGELRNAEVTFHVDAAISETFDR